MTVNQPVSNKWKTSANKTDIKENLNNIERFTSQIFEKYPRIN